MCFRTSTSQSPCRALTFRRKITTPSSETSRAFPPAILNHAIAHEIRHLLFGLNVHSQEGITQAK